MNQQYSREALIEFIEYLADKGLMNRATASSRKAASSRLLAILTDEEARAPSVQVESMIPKSVNL